jgi:hypothetical protein
VLRDLPRDARIPAVWPLKRAPLLLETSLPGVFAAGDVRHRSVKRVASAVGEGAITVQMIHHHLSDPPLLDRPLTCYGAPTSPSASHLQCLLAHAVTVRLSDTPAASASIGALAIAENRLAAMTNASRASEEDAVCLIGEMWRKPGADAALRGERRRTLDILLAHGGEMVYSGHPFEWVAGDGPLPDG